MSLVICLRLKRLHACKCVPRRRRAFSLTRMSAHGHKDTRRPKALVEGFASREERLTHNGTLLRHVKLHHILAEEDIANEEPLHAVGRGLHTSLLGGREVPR